MQKLESIITGREDAMSGDTIKVKIHKAEEGGYWAEVENMPGCITEGETLEEVRSNLKEAILGWLLAQIPSSAYVKPGKSVSKAGWAGNSRTETFALSTIAK
jgi:predicted RNase H-like HicB family nuclease